MKREVQVYLEVEVDETKFTPEFMSEFRESMYDFDTIDDHIEHLAQMYARGVFDAFTNFIEGYGAPDDMGIKANIQDADQEIVGVR